MPGGDGVPGGAGCESSRVRFCFTSRRVGAKREFAYLCHSELSPALHPRSDRFYCLARTLVVRVFFLKNRKDLLGKTCGLECP